MIVIIILFLCLVPVMPSRADEDRDGMISITIRNDAIFPLRIQARDDVCMPEESDESGIARSLTESTECQQPFPPEECVRAQEMITGSSCIAGLVYDGMLGDGDSVEIEACPGGSGYARISVHAPDRNAPWHTYRLLSEGDTVKYP